MKLYHATALANKDNILRCGIVPGMIQTCGHLIDTTGIYGFDNLPDALSFAKDQCWRGGVVVFSFEAEAILDPEYEDGEAYFVATEDSIPAILEHEIEY